MARFNLNAIKSLLQGKPYLSTGAVQRNYVKGSHFQPEKQLRGITYKAVDKIASVTSTYEPLVKKQSGDAYENHPLYNLYENPNPKMTASDFIYLWSMLNTVYGETFWYKVRGEQTGKIKELYLLNPAQVELKIEDGDVVGYILHKTNGEQVPFMPEEILHDKVANPFNEYRGMSIIERASVYIDTEITTSVFTLNYMHNNASPSGIVSLPKMEKDAFRQFVHQWREGYEGPENAGKTAFIRGGEAEFKAVGATLKDVDQKITREMAKQDVLMMLEVPKPLLGIADESGLGRGNVESLEYIFSKYTIEPKMKRLDRIYTQLVKELDRTPVYVEHESIVPEDKEFTHKQNSELVNIAITVNEVRERIGLPPLPNGDVLIPSNTVQVTNSAKVTLKKSKTPEEIKKEVDVANEDFRKRLIENNEAYAIKMKRTISKFASDKEKEVIAKINATSKTYDEWLFNIKEASDELAVLLTPIVLELMEEQSKDVANFITGELITITDEIKNNVQGRIVNIAGVYNTDTILKLQETLAEGQAAGESLAKLKKRVESTFSDAKGYRAERIARTESLHASNLTAEYTYSQNGFSTVEWFINPGACEFCRAFAGRQKQVGGKYSNIGDVVTGADGGQLAISYSDIDTPPLHPQCTCSLIPVK